MRRRPWSWVWRQDTPRGEPQWAIYGGTWVTSRLTANWQLLRGRRHA